jgi:cytochrome c2
MKIGVTATGRYNITATLGAFLLAASSTTAIASCAEDLTRIEIAASSTTSEIRSNTLQLPRNAEAKAKRKDFAGCEVAVQQALRVLQLPTLAPLKLSTPAASGEPPPAFNKRPVVPAMQTRQEGSGPAVAAATVNSGEANEQVRGVQTAVGSDPDQGQVIAQRLCAACHTFNQGGPTRVGPNLFGVAQRPIASVPGYKYSAALKGHSGQWDESSLDAFLKDPRGFAPGTYMIFPGIRSETDRRNVVAYLEKLGETTGAAK